MRLVNPAISQAVWIVWMQQIVKFVTKSRIISYIITYAEDVSFLVVSNARTIINARIVMRLTISTYRIIVHVRNAQCRVVWIAYLQLNASYVILLENTF